MSPDVDNLLGSIPEPLTEELFTQLVEGEAFRVERIVSRGHISPESGWYDQHEHEWVIVVQGEARLSFPDGQIEHLVAGSYLNIPARTRHKVIWTAPDVDTVWLAIHYR